MGWQPLPHAQHPWGNLAIPLPISPQRIKDLWIKQKLQIKTPSLGRSPAPILLSHSSFTFRLAFLHTIIAQTLSRSPACSCWGLAATWAKPEPPLLLPPPQPLNHHSTDLAPPAWGRMVAKCSHHPALLPLAGYPSGTCLSTVSKHRLNSAGARAFGNCTPRLWNSLSAYHPAKHRLQRFSLLEHVRQRSWHLCPLDPTAPCQPRRGKAVLWRRLLPLQLPENTRFGSLCLSLHPLSALFWIMFFSEFTAIQVSLAIISHVWSSQVSNRAKLYCSIL